MKKSKIIFSFGIVVCTLFSTTIFATIKYVSPSGTHIPPFSSWATAANNIQSAIVAAADGDVVLVTNGIYSAGAHQTPGGMGMSFNRIVIEKNISVRSVNGSKSTTILGAGIGTNIVRCAYLSKGELVGFTLSNGHTQPFMGYEEESYGGGAFLNGSNCVVRNCVISGNEASSGGGVACAWGGGSVINCEIVGNIASNISMTSGGGVYCNSFHSEILNCDIHDNISFGDGGGVYCCYPSVEIRNSVIHNNKSFGIEEGGGGGVFSGKILDSVICSNTSACFGGGANLSYLNRCYVFGNTAEFGGGVSESFVINSLINNNSAVRDGGGVYMGGIANSTICQNHSLSNNAGGIHDCSATNSIIYFNSPNNYNFGGQFSAYISSCTTPLPIDGIYENIITNNPLFISASDYHLSSNSPCVNSGTNLFIQESFDLDGKPRNLNGGVDMGAFEFSNSPSNSFFDGAFSLMGSTGVFIIDNTHAYHEPCEPEHSGNEGPFHSVWWNWTAPSNGVLELDTSGSAFDTVLAVYTGATLCTLVEITSTNTSPPMMMQNSANSKTGPVFNFLSLKILKDVVYRIVVDGAGETKFGQIKLNWFFKLNASNDDFVNAIILNGNQGLVTGSNAIASGEAGEPVHAENNGPYNSVWWKWTALSNGTIKIDTQGSDFDTVLGMYTGFSVNALTEIASNDDEEKGGAEWSEIIISVIAGETYYFAVDGYTNGSIGNIVLNWNFFIVPNDDFNNAIELVGNSGVVPGNNIGATAEQNEPEHALNGGPFYSVWWKWTAPGPGEFSIKTESSFFDTVLAMYTGSAVDSLTEIASNDDDEGGDFWSEITTNAIAGETYYFAIDGLDDAEYGNITLSWNFIPDVIPPPQITSFSINNDDASITNRAVVLNNSCINNPTEYLASENSSFIGASWQSYSSLPGFTVAPGTGTKTIYFKVRNGGGESAVVNDSISLIVSPGISSLDINNGTVSTTNNTVVLNNSCINNPTEYSASENSDFSGAGWNAYSLNPSFTLSAGEGGKTVYFKVRNIAGKSIVVSDTITLIVQPSVTNFTINNSAATTSNRLVVLNNSAFNSPMHYMASENNLFSNATWNAYLPSPDFFINSSGAGTKTIYFKTKNSAGESAVIFDDIILEEIINSQSGTGFYMRVVESDITVGDIFHVQLLSELNLPWDYICQHVERDSSSRAEFSFLDALPAQIAPAEHFTTDLGADLYDVKITANSNIVNGINDGVFATLECQAEKDGNAVISYIAKAGGFLYKTETCALTNNIDVLKSHDNHLDGMYDLEFNIKPNKAGIILELNTELQQYWTGDTVSVELRLDNLLTTHYDTVSLLLGYNSQMLKFSEVRNCEIIPDNIEIDTLPNGNSNLISIVSSWNQTTTSTGCIMNIDFTAFDSGKTKIIPIAPNSTNPTPYFGTTVVKNWIDVLDSPDTWIMDMPNAIKLDIRPYKNCAFVAVPDSNNIFVGDDLNVHVKAKAINKANVDSLGLVVNYDSARFDFINFIPNSSLLTNVYWEDTGNYLWLTANTIYPVSNINEQIIGSLDLEAINPGDANISFQFLPPPDSFSDNSTFAMWNGADVLGNVNNPTDGVAGCSIIIEDLDVLQAYFKIDGKDVLPNGTEFEAAIIGVTNDLIDPDYIELEFKWDVNKFNYKSYEIISKTASFLDNVNTNDGKLTLWSDNIVLDDCIGIVAVVRLIAINEGDTKLELVPPIQSIGNGTILLDSFDNDLLGFDNNSDDGIINKEVVITETEAFHLYFDSSINIVSPGEEFFFDVIITNFASGFFYSNVAVMIEFDSANVSVLSVSNANLAGAVTISETNFGDFYAIEFVWPEPTNTLGILAGVKAVTANDSPVALAYAFGNSIGAFPGTYALNGGADMLGSPNFEQDGADDLNLENDGLPYGATLHLISPTNVLLGEIFTAELILSNNSAVKVTSLNIMFDVEKDSFEVEEIFQGELGGTLAKSEINHLNGRIQYSETFDQPTLVSGVVCKLEIFTRNTFGFGSLDSVVPSSQYDDDGTFLRNGYTDVLGWSSDKKDGGADMNNEVYVDETDFPSLYLDDYNEYEIDSSGSMVIGEIGKDFLENRNINSDSLVWEIEQIQGDKADLAVVLPIPPYPMLVYPKVGSVGTQIFKVTVSDYEDPLQYSYDYVGLIIDSTEELNYPVAADEITYTKPDYSYNTKSGKCSFENGVFNITGGSDKDSLIIKSIGNFESINSDSGLKMLSMQGSLNNLNVNGPLGTVKVKNGTLGNVSAASVKKIIITAPRHYVKDESSFDDAIDEAQGLIGSVACDGDIGTIIVKSGDVGALDFNGDYGQTVISSNGSIGKIIVKGKKRNYLEKGYGINAYLGGGNIFANVLAPNGSIKKILANNNIGWENIDQPAIISAANGIGSITIAWAKLRDGDAPAFLANVFSTGEVKRITLKGANLGSDDLQTTIYADSIKSVNCKLWRDYYVDDGDPWVDIYGGEFYINIIANNSVKSIMGAGDYFTSRILTGGDINNVTYKGYKDEEGDLWGGDIEDSFIAAGLKTDGTRNSGSLKNIKAGNNIIDSTIQAGCIYADPTPGYLGIIKKISAKASITDSTIGSRERPKFNKKQARARITYYIDGTKQ